MAKTLSVLQKKNSDQKISNAKNVRPDREKTRCISAHVPEELYWQLKSMTIENRTDMQSLVIEATNELFKKYKKPAFPSNGNVVGSKLVAFGK